MKCNSICIVGMPEGEEEKQGIENLFEKVMTKYFINSMREEFMQVQEAQRVPIKMNPKMPHQDTSKLKWQNSKTKRVLKAAREKQLVTYEVAPIRLSADLSKETL